MVGTTRHGPAIVPISPTNGKKAMTRTDIQDNNDNGPQDAGQAQQPGTAAADCDRLQKERDELFDRLVRTTAEFKNSQRRLEQDKEQAVQYANSSLIKSLLPVIDNFDRALAVDPAKADVGSLLKGLQIVNDQFHTILKQNHVESIDPQPGEKFDPTKHEALMHQPSDKYPDHTVVQTLQKGYAMHGRTLRPAGVIVSQGQ
jgi:molecular chaperone GrpE